MTPLPHLAAVRFTGQDARDFLHAQLSADIGGLEPGTSVTACYCNPKGRVLDHLLVRADEDGALTVLLAADRVPAFVQRVRMFVLRSDVRLEPLEGVTVKGGVDDSAAVFEGPGGLCYALAPPADAQPSAADLAGQAFAELERGMLWLDEAASGRYLPQMIGLDTLGSVNFRKGCYPGQEVVARARYLGKVKRLPALAIVEGVAALATGETVSLAPPDDGGPEAEVVAAVAHGGRTAVFVVVRDRDALAPSALRCGDRVLPVQRWATM